MREDRTAEAPTPSDVDRYRANLQGEIDGAALYDVMAAAEKDPALRELYRRLAATEVRHGAVWRERLEDAGIAALPRRPNWPRRAQNPTACRPRPTRTGS